MRLAKGRTMRALDPELLRALLRYDAETGALFWKERPVEMFIQPLEAAVSRARRWNARYAGRPALTHKLSGYLRGSVCSKTMLAHRVAWAIHHGAWTEDYLDHINGVRDDNRIVNLREVDDAENHRNMKRPSNNKSGVIGVFFEAGKWRARITDRRRIHNLGSFETKEEAVAARKRGERQFGFHENHGRDG